MQQTARLTALAVDAKDRQAAAFYRHHGFVTFESHPLRLFLPLATVGSSD